MLRFYIVNVYSEQHWENMRFPTYHKDIEHKIYNSMHSIVYMCVLEWILCELIAAMKCYKISEHDMGVELRALSQCTIFKMNARDCIKWYCSFFNDISY